MSNAHLHPIFEKIVDAFVEAQKPTVRPVEIRECGYCGGMGYVDVRDNVERCLMCGGRGRIATEGGEV